jgi:hypothetical protein
MTTFQDLHESLDDLGGTVLRLRSERDRYKAALESITKVAGNLSDEMVESIGGVNDGKSRALMVVIARKTALEALGRTVADL